MQNIDPPIDEGNIASADNDDIPGSLDEGVEDHLGAAVDQHDGLVGQVGQEKVGDLVPGTV